VVRPFSPQIPLVLLVFVLLSNVFAAETDSTTVNFRIKAIRVDKMPVVDGNILNDPVWQTIPPARHFWQTAPYEGNPASEETEVRIIYNANILYIGVVCYDSEPSGIVVTHSRRDGSLNNSDCVQILLDTFHDKQNGFLFGTNPSGIEYDAQITNEGQGEFGGNGGGGFNLNWDASWQVETEVSEIGWCAEFAIPFRSIRYARGDSQTWGVNFQRNIRRRNENSYWTKLPRQFNIQKVSLAGTLTGLHQIGQKNLKLMPYVLGESNRDYLYQSDAHWDENFGIDAKYSLSPSMTLDMTYNTDFAQVEVDEQQINLDRFNLFFPEKRPFFLENAGYFSVGSPEEVELFFSRRIGINQGREVPIAGGARLSGKAAGWNVGLLNMQTRSTNNEIYEDDSVAIDTVASSNYTVARLSRELPNRSALGGIFVNRNGTGVYAPDDDYNRTVGLDGRWGIGKYLNLSGFAARTFTTDRKDKEHAFNFEGNYNAEAWMFSAAYSEVAANFNPEVGFLSRSNYRKPSFMVLYRYRPEDWLGFMELRPHVSYQGYWNFDGFQETGYLHIDNHWEWRSGYEVHTGINFRQEGVREPFEIHPDIFVNQGEYHTAETQLVFNTNRAEWWSFSGRSIIGGFFSGNRINFSGGLQFRAGNTLNTEFSLARNDIDLPEGDFITNLIQARVNYSFTTSLFISTLLQYNDRDDILAANIRFGWQRSANTGLFVVYNDSRIEETGRFRTRYRSFIVKYSHLLDLLN
jgi:hypothetical protein